MRKSNFLGACAALALAGGLSSPAMAQGTSDTGADAADSTWAGDIIVTARRREETAQETPVAMTVLNDALLDRYAVHGIDNIASLTPGFFTGETTGAVGGSISLRGVGSGEAQAFIDQAVSINVDGVPISTAQILRAAQMDLQQIEVLRGPQALFFGKNSPGGIISLTTASPGEELEGMVRGGYEFKANEWYIDGNISAPLSDSVGIRLAGHYSDMDGYINVISPVELIPAPNPGILPSELKAFPKRKELFLRGTLAFEPTDQLDITLKGTYVDTKIKGGGSYFSDITYCPYGTPQEFYPVASNCSNDGTIVAAQIPANALALNPLFKPNGHRNNEQWLLTGTINYQLTDTLKLTSVSGYYKIDETMSSHGGYGLAPSNVFTVEYKDKKFTEELRLASDFDGVVNFLVGGFYEDRDLWTRTYIVVPIAGTCPDCLEYPYESTGQNQKSYSLFGQLLFDVNDQFQLTAGGRYTHEAKRVNEFLIAIQSFVFPYDPAPIIEDTPIDFIHLPTYTTPTKLTFNDFSPEVTLTFKPVEDVMVFASYKQGYKSGGFDGAYTGGAIFSRGYVQSFEPEEVEGLELGLKSSLFDRQLLLNLTAYTYDYSNLQVTTYDTAARSFGTGNAAKSRVRGIEMETVFRPRSIPGLEIHGTAAYNRAKFREFFAQCYKSQNVALGCDNDFNATTGRYNTQDLAGVQLRKAPKFTATFGGYYETPVSSGLMASLSADMSYSSKYNYGTDYQPYTVQKAFAKLDASFRVFTEDKKYELAVIGRNLTNKRNLINGIDRTGTGGVFGSTAPVCTSIGPNAPAGCIPYADVIGTPAQPRSVAVQATFRY